MVDPFYAHIEYMNRFVVLQHVKVYLLLVKLRKEK